jgi:hypothetical protein
MFINLTASSAAAAAQQTTDGGIGAPSNRASNAVYTAQTSFGYTVHGVGHSADGVFTHTQNLVHGAVQLAEETTSATAAAHCAAATLTVGAATLTVGAATLTVGATIGTAGFCHFVSIKRNDFFLYGNVGELF